MQEPVFFVLFGDVDSLREVSGRLQHSRNRVNFVRRCADKKV